MLLEDPPAVLWCGRKGRLEGNLLVEAMTRQKGYCAIRMHSRTLHLHPHRKDDTQHSPWIVLVGSKLASTHVLLHHTGRLLMLQPLHLILALLFTIQLSTRTRHSPDFDFPGFGGLLYQSIESKLYQPLLMLLPYELHHVKAVK